MKISFADEVGPLADRPAGRCPLPECREPEAGAAPAPHVVGVHRSGLMHREGKAGKIGKKDFSDSSKSIFLNHHKLTADNLN